MTGIISAKQKLAGRACSPRPIRLPATETFRSCQPCLAYAPSPWAECVKSCSIALLGRGPQDTQGKAKQGRAWQGRDPAPGRQEEWTGSIGCSFRLMGQRRWGHVYVNELRGHPSMAMGD